MYILEIPNAKQRKEALLHIINSIYGRKLSSIDQAFAISGFSFIEHSEKTKTKSIGINDLTPIKRGLWLTTVDGPKLAIINNAQDLTVAAQNALLKDLEEEPEDGIFILATSDTRLLLPTILSRGICIQINQIHLIHEQINEEKFAHLVYNGKVEKDIRYIEDFLNKPLYDALLYAHSILEKEPKENSQIVPVISEKEDLVESFLIDLLLYYEQLLLSQSSVLLQKDIELVQKGIERIRKGVNKKAVLEQIILTINHG